MIFDFGILYPRVTSLNISLLCGNTGLLALEYNLGEISSLCYDSFVFLGRPLNEFSLKIYCTLLTMMN